MDYFYDDDKDKLTDDSEAELETAIMDLIKRNKCIYLDEHIALLT